MAQYELVHEIQNLCPNNQMRDIFFKEVETDDPQEYVRQFLKGKIVELTTDSYVREQLKGRVVEIITDAKANGAVTVYASCDGLTQKFVFSPI